MIYSPFFLLACFLVSAPVLAMPFATLLRLVFQRRTDSDGCRAEALRSLSLMLSSLSPSSHHSSSHTHNIPPWPKA